MVSQFRPLHVASFSHRAVWRCVVPAVVLFVYKLYVVTQVCFLLRCSVWLTVSVVKLSFTSSRKLHLTPPHSAGNLGKLRLTRHDTGWIFACSTVSSAHPCDMLGLAASTLIRNICTATFQNTACPCVELSGCGCLLWEVCECIAIIEFFLWDR